MDCLLEAPLAVAGEQAPSPEPPRPPLSLLPEHRLDRPGAFSVQASPSLGSELALHAPRPRQPLGDPAPGRRIGVRAPPVLRCDQEFHPEIVFQPEVVIAQVAGIGDHHPHRVAHPRRGQVLRRLLDHRLQLRKVGGVGGDLAGDGDLVLGGDGLGVEPLEIPAIRGRQDAAVRVGGIGQGGVATVPGPLLGRFGLAPIPLPVRLVYSSRAASLAW